MRVAVAGILLVALGCSSYEPEPLNERALLSDLRSVRLEMPADGLDPDQAVAAALLHNPGLQVWRREHEVAANLVISEGAWKNPELRLSFQNLYAKFGNPFLLAAGLRFFPAIPGELDAKVARAQAHEKRVLAEIEDREARVAADTRIAHAKALLVEEKLLLLDVAERLHARVVSVIDQRLAAAAATRVDQMLASLKREELSDGRESLLAEKEQVLAELSSLLGTTGGPIKLRARAAAEPTPVLAQERLEEEALRERPDLKSLREDYEVREQNLRLAHLAHSFWPRFLEPSVEKLPSNPSAEINSAWELPIFNGGDAEVAVAEARRRQAREAFAARLHAARGEIRQATLKMREAERRKKYLTDRLEPLLQQAEELLKLVLDAGEGDALKILAIETRVLDARRDAAQAAYDRERARVELAVSTGSVHKRGPPE
jgi:outer membrane protein TolC